MHYGLVTDQSRKAKQAKTFYEYVRTKTRSEPLSDAQVGDIKIHGGFRLLHGDRHRVVNLRLMDEHLSPYFRTDMNLFHLLMIDDSIDMSIFKTPEGILFVFEGLPNSPRPFGVHGYDPR